MKLNDIYNGFRLVSYENSNEVTVESTTTGYQTVTTGYRFTHGLVRDRLNPCVNETGFIGSGKYKSGQHKRAYRTWRSITKNCCLQWRNFQIFAEWYYDNLKENCKFKRYDIDECYSPDNCGFEPKMVMKKKKRMTNRLYVLYDSQGERVEFTNVAKFVRDNNLNYQLVFKLLRGESKTHRGWRLRYKAPKKKQLQIYDYNGDLHTIDDVVSFCKCYELDVSCITEVIKGERRSYKGWFAVV